MYNTTPRRMADDYSSDSSSSNNSEYEDSPTDPTESIHAMEGFSYPPVWSDDTLMDLLMGSFRVRDLDPQSYDSKMIFWQELIADYCVYKRNASFSKRELQMAFKRNNRIPYGFDQVLEQMLQTKQIRRRKEYEYDPLNSWTGWAINSFLKKPLYWGMRRLPLIGRGDEDAAQIEYIHLDVMQKICNALKIVLQQHAGQLLHFETLKQQIEQELHMSGDIINLCLQTLNSQRQIGLEYHMDMDNVKRIHLVKIPGLNDANIEITETNRAMHNLQMTQRNLQQQLESIENDVKVNEEKARQYIKDGKRQLAKTYLRKKQLLERNHEKRSLALHNIETLLCSVDEAQSNGEILDAYKIGSKALQNMLNESGLKYDNVDEVISEVRETIENHNELQDTLANANIAESMVGDDDALERELKEIVGEPTEAPLPATPKRSKEATAAKSTTNKPAVEVANKNRSNNNNAVKQIEITDAELLEMLDGLEVEDNSPKGPDKSAKVAQSKIAASEPL